EGDDVAGRQSEIDSTDGVVGGVIVDKNAVQAVGQAGRPGEFRANEIAHHLVAGGADTIDAQTISEGPGDDVARLGRGAADLIGRAGDDHAAGGSVEGHGAAEVGADQ